MKKILFANIGWMQHYQGNTKTDYIKGGGAWNNARKHEVYNFLPVNGWCFGYVQPASDTINLNRIDKQCKGDVLEDVLVVWMAPFQGKGSRLIIGWYKHATIFRYYQKGKPGMRGGYGYYIMAKAQDCTLLPVLERTFLVPKKKNFSGQRNIWYADQNAPATRQFRKDVWDYIHNYAGKKSSKSSKAPTKVDPNAKKKVEKAAIKHVTNCFKGGGYTVTSVEKENKGWDLEAVKRNLTALLEVKGLAGNEISVRITENEYNMLTKKSNCFLCVVTNAIISPTLYIFEWDKKNSFFVSIDGNGLILNIDLIPSYHAYVE